MKRALETCWRPLCATERGMVSNTPRCAPASGGSWLSPVIQDLVGQRWALLIPSLRVSWHWRNLGFGLHAEQTWADLHLALTVVLLAWPPLADAGAGPGLMPAPHAASWLDAVGWARAPGWDIVGWTQQEKRAFVNLCQKHHVYLQGVGPATGSSLNLASKSNFKGNHLQISNCLLVLMSKAPCIPPVAMLSSPWNYFQHVF